jgi:hypothetical protein
MAVVPTNASEAASMLPVPRATPASTLTDQIAAAPANSTVA